MDINILIPRKALNKAFLKIKPNRIEIEKFKANLIQLIDHTNDKESEEFHKNLISDFLKKTYYDGNHFINTKNRNDLVIHTGNDAKSTVGVIIEAKSTTNKSEMISKNKINSKAFQELVLYYLRERITHHNLEVKNIVATNIYEWFIFDANVFEKLFAQNKSLVKQFTDFENGRLAGTKTDFFYKEIAEPFIKDLKQTIDFTHFDIREYDKPLRNNDAKDDNQLIALYKLLSPEHLLKLPFANDSNSLDKRFYGELLHIIGLTEVKDGGKKLIQRFDEGKRNSGSLLENTITQLDAHDKLNQLSQPSQFGETRDERLFSVAMELTITWINRILFLKLLEAQLITYHKGDKSYSFLNFDQIKDYDELDELFFQVLARKYDIRNEDVKEKFKKVPYLNSSLFEPTDLEQITLFISNLKDNRAIPVYSSTVLKDETGKKKSNEINTLEYFFDFLNAYDFSSEGSEAIQEDNKTLINASVLGLIFEKINGYKDGSFFTPGFITMYMCKETIRKAVVQKFNETKAWNVTEFESLYDKIEDRKEANEIVNSIKICDPAVGSGHFLVSALNEVIAIKNDLRILQDYKGTRLKEYQIEVVNDELIVTDEDGILFEYNPTNKESQRIQETLFHEKQTIIEKCLFGVDINPNSVKICRLRLWVELLKSAYYKNKTELETLPNIDINIKCGNSLISRFALDSDLSSALKKSKWNIDSYKLAVDTYRNATSKEQKREMEGLINDIKSDFRTEIGQNSKEQKDLIKFGEELYQKYTAPKLFEDTLSPAQKKKQEKERKDLEEKVVKLKNTIEEVKSNKIYGNAFEWRFEFPDVLDSDGEFVGFDAVIGNPPYVFGGNEGIDENSKKVYKNTFVSGSGKINLFTIFIEHSFNIMKDNASFSFIIPNTFLRVTSYNISRKLLFENNTVHSVYDFGNTVFEDAITTAIVINASKYKPKFDHSILVNNNGIINSLNQNSLENANYVVTMNIDSSKAPIFEKFSKDNILLGEICREMIFGVVITKNKDEVVDSIQHEGWKPFIEGKDINAYIIKPIHSYLNYDKNLLHRARSLEVFESCEKILVQRITGGNKPIKAAYDDRKIYNKESINNIILKDDSDYSAKFILGLLNSKLINWFYTNSFTNGSTLTVNLSKEYLSQIPIKKTSKIKQEFIIQLVNKILDIKNANAESDTNVLENEIDELVYQLYELTEEEIKVVEGSVK